MMSCVNERCVRTQRHHCERTYGSTIQHVIYFWIIFKHILDLRHLAESSRWIAWRMAVAHIKIFWVSNLAWSANVQRFLHPRCQDLVQHLCLDDDLECNSSETQLNYLYQAMDEDSSSDDDASSGSSSSSKKKDTHMDLSLTLHIYISLPFFLHTSAG